MTLDRILDEPGYGSIPDDQLDLLKQEVSLQRLAEGVNDRRQAYIIAFIASLAP